MHLKKGTGSNLNLINSNKVKLKLQPLVHQTQTIVVAKGDSAASQNIGERMILIV